VRIARFSHQDSIRFGIVDDTDLVVLSGDPMFAGYDTTGERVPISDAVLLAPVIPRSKIVCVGRNYRDHAAELGNDVPSEPLMFLKPSSSIIGPRDPIRRPPQSKQVEHEAELAVVIGARGARRIDRANALKAVFGYTVANDVTARDLQRRDVQFTRAKGFDSFCPLGPWIETELDPSDLEVRCEVNGEVRQLGRTRDMVFDVATLVSYVSHVMTLLPGDVILTGTPAGVGPLVAGDTCVVRVEGIGEIANPVIDLE
jgi:2-keto-4-pentenoate hydratase/2-oxohepta-3-ene-1,7-dioic acid hydratase in catechol pathway